MSINEMDIVEYVQASKDTAKMAKVQYDANLEAGFSSSQAMYLTGIWCKVLFSAQAGQNEDDDD